MTRDEHKPIESLAMALLDTLNGTQNAPPSASAAYHALEGNYYGLLGLERGSTCDQIMAALCRLRTRDSSFPVLSALDNAETVLLDPELRARYDATLA